MPSLQPLLSHLPASLQSSMSGFHLNLHTWLSQQSWTSIAITSGLGYLALCRALRYRRERAMRKRYGFPDRESLKRMTAADAQKIIAEIISMEFPLLAEKSLEFALFKTYGVESISRLLLATRNLTDPVASLKRFEDTGVLIGEFSINPPDSPRSLAAIARMNYLHSKYIQAGQISNADLLYTLSVFITEPERWIRLFEWRALNDMELCAYGVFWKNIGDAMDIRYDGFLNQSTWTDGLEFARDIAQWAKAYDVVAFKPSVTSNRPAKVLIPMLTYWIPAGAQDFAQECVNVLLGDRVREAFMLPEPGLSAVVTVYMSLWLRRFFLRHLSLPRITPILRHQDPSVQDLDKPLHLNLNYGNFPFYLKPTLWSRWGPEAWFYWALGGKIAGDDPDDHLARGYRFADLGPLNRMGKGQGEMDADMERMLRKGMGGCPFR